KKFFLLSRKEIGQYENFWIVITKVFSWITKELSTKKDDDSLILPLSFQLIQTFRNVIAQIQENQNQALYVSIKLIERGERMVYKKKKRVNEILPINAIFFIISFFPIIIHSVNMNGTRKLKLFYVIFFQN